MFDMLTSPYTHPLKKLIWMRLKAGARAVWETISGNPVSFTAKAAPLRQLKVAFSPVQSLNGYDAPWPAGGGKNILPNTYATATMNGVTFTVESDGTIKTSGTATGGDADFFLINAVALDGLLESGNTYYFSGCPLGGSTATYFCRLNVTGDADTGSGFTRAFNGVTIGNFTIRIKEGTNSNGLVFKPQIVKSSVAVDWTPYSNECPISGWDGVTVEQRGKNLLNPDISAYSTNTNYRYLNGVVPDGQVARMTITDKDTSVDVSGCYIGFTDTDLSEYGIVSHSKWVIDNGVVKTNATNTTGTGGAIIMSNVFIYPKTQEAFDKLFARYNIMVELGSTASPYQPYNPSSRSISISLGQTVYSGWVDVVTGVVTVTHASETYNGTEAWGRDPLLHDTARFFLGKNEMKKYVDYTSSPYIIFSNRMPTVKNYVDFAGTTYLAVTGYSITSNLQNYVYVMSHYAATGIETVDQLKAWLANNPLQVCYELAEPIPIQLTPQEVESLAGDNVLFSDANGDLTVEYRSN